MIVTLITLGTLAALAAGYAYLRFRPVKEQPFHYCRCPGCEQKIRYAETKAGREVMCPRCRQRWSLPATPQALPRAERLNAVSGGRGQLLLRRVR